MKKVVTLLFIRNGDTLLLAMKKRGHGVGKWNGVGGKVEQGETIKQAAVRECQEEIGVTPLNPVFAGRVHFYELGDPNFYHDCHIFVAERWQGNPVETEEMRPKWFHISGLPYDSMWADDPLWLPHLLARRQFSAQITLDDDRIHHHDITIGRLPSLV